MSAPSKFVRLSTSQRRWRLAASAVALSAAWLFCDQPVLAQTAGQETSVTLIDLADVDDTEQMLIEADELIYDNENETVSAVGNVQIYYGPYTLQAGRVTYNQRTARVRAEGNVRITEPDGNVITAQVADLTDDFRDGFVRSLTVETPDRTRIAAANAERTGDNVTVFNRGVYTACEPCKENPSKPPLWQVKAVRIVHDQKARMIYYENAAIEFFGLPIAYFPYFSTPDPTVDRKTGFLTPGFRASDTLGFGVEVPYFINVAPNKDITLRPVFTTRQGVLGLARWRHRTQSGTYTVSGGGIYQLDPDSEDNPRNPGDDREWRGFARTTGQFAINSRWSYGWDATIVSDDGFLKSYELSSDNWLTSEAFLTGLSDRNYFNASTYHFRRLIEADFDQSRLPVALPSIDYNYVFNRSILGGEVGFDSQFYALHRGDIDDAALIGQRNAGTFSEDDYSYGTRFVGEVYWRRTLIDNWGQLFTPFAAVRGDLSHTTSGYNAARQTDDTVADEWQPLAYGDESVARVIPTLGLDYRYPFASAQSWGTQTFEPIAQLYYRPDLHGDANDSTNEDALSLVFDATSLFDRDKFSGYDRVETGFRANVGFRYTARFNAGGQAQFVVGQSFDVAGANPFPTDSGLEDHASDYVAGASFDYKSLLRFRASARFDADTLAVRRNDITASTQVGRVGAAVTYALINAQPALGSPGESEQAQIGGTLQVTEEWMLSANSRYDFRENEVISNGLGLHFADECFTLGITYSESYTSGTEEIDRTFGISFNLRTLGGLSTNSSTLTSYSSDQ